MSGIVGDNTARASGVIASAGGGGKILQVVETQVTAAMTCNATTPTYETGLTRAITPIAAGSKIYVTMGSGIMSGNNNGFIFLYFDVAGGGYNKCVPYGDAAGSRTRSHGFTGSFNLGTGPFSVSILHTPTYSLTEEITYRVYAEIDNSSYPFYIGRTKTDSNDDNHPRTQSTLTCMEIGA